MKRTFFRNTLLPNITLIAFIFYSICSEEYLMALLGWIIFFHLVEHEKEMIFLNHEVRRLEIENLKLIKKKNEENLGE
jgi:hypothetical protein